MTELKEPIEAVIARLRHSTNLGWVDSADGHEGATVRVSDLSRLLDYVEGMRALPQSKCSMREIGREFGVSAPAVGDIATRLKLPPRGA